MCTVRRMASRPRTTPEPITSVRIETPAPELRRKADGEVRCPRSWQKQAIDKLRGSPRRLMSAPTGSGKSLVVESLGLHDLALGRKVIVAVPQLAIGRGYERELIELDGEHREWNPAIHVHAADVRSIVRFLVDPPATSGSGRTIVCTHLALVMAAEQLNLAATDPWKDVSLFLDEAHHAMALVKVAGRRRRAPRSLENALGAIVNHYLRAGSGPLTLVTATWMRTDNGAIVPASQLGAFERYHRGFDEHMKDMRHVRSLEIRFLIGVATECLETLFRERHPSELKTVVWHPAPGSHLLDRQGGKQGALAKYRKVTGWCPRRTGVWDRHQFDGKPFTAVELIEEGDRRDVAMDRLLAGIDAQKRAMREHRDTGPEMRRTPDVVWALNLLREGSDYPALARGILMAPRGAMIDTLQMLGRLLRDFPNKERVEFNIILPIEGPAVAPTAEQVSKYLKYMMASLLVEWQFRGFGLGSLRVTEEERRQLLLLERSDVQQQLASDIVDAAVRCVDAGLAPAEEAERIADDVTDRGRSMAGLSPGSRKIVKQRLKQMLVGRTVGSASDVDVFDVEATLVGRLRSFVGRFGYDDFRKLREGLNRTTTLTIEQVHAAMKRFHDEHGRWPGLREPNEPADLGGTWLRINAALQTGLRGLSGGSSLARERDALLGLAPRVRLTRQMIIDAVVAYHREHGVWPNCGTSGRVAQLGNGYSWSTIIQTCKKGKLGFFPKGYTLLKLVKACQGEPEPSALKPIRMDTVRKAMRRFRNASGEWPRTTSPGEVPLIGGRWRTLNGALWQGRRGLPKQDADGHRLTLARIAERLSPPLTIELIRASMVAWRKKNGEWPTKNTKGVDPKTGLKWSTLNRLLNSGRRGLARGLSLAAVRRLIEN